MMKMTNYDKIMKMSIEELAQALHNGMPCECCLYNDERPEECEIVSGGCLAGIEQWLESEADE